MNWTCDDTRRAMLRSQELPDEAIEHLAGCELCQHVSDVAALTSVQESAPIPINFERVLSTTQQELARERGLVAWLRSRRLSLQRSVSLVVAFVPVSLQLVFARRADFGELPESTIAIFVVAYIVAIVYATALLLSPMYRVRSERSLWIAALIAVVLPLAYIGVMAHGFAGNHHMGGEFFRSAGACLRYGTLLALPSVLLPLVMDRYTGRHRVIGLLAAALGGAVGNFILLLHCASPDPAHQLAGHATIGLALLLLLGAAGALAKVGPLR